MPASILPIASPNASWRIFDPFLRPEWRWERVLELLDGSGPVKGRVSRKDDMYIRGAKTFLAHWRRAHDESARTKLLKENPGMCFAYQIYDKSQNFEPETAFMLEAMLLANKPQLQIADDLNTCPEAIDWYEAVYFNVTPRLRNLGWILKHVLLPSADRFTPEPQPAVADNDQHRVTLPVIRPHLDATIKFFAYFGGPVMVDFMLTGFRRGIFCHTQEEIAQWLNDQWMHQMSRRSAMAAGMFQVDKWSVELLFMTHARIVELQKGAANQDERRTLIEKHIGTMLTELPWVHGAAAQEVFKDTDLGRYDNMAAELRDEEVQLVSAGDNPRYLEELPLLNVGTHSGKEAKQDGNPKQP